jgi:hypothetical protein
MDRGGASIYQQIKNGHYNKYFFELAYSVRIGEFWSRSFFFLQVYGPRLRLGP